MVISKIAALDKNKAASFIDAFFAKFQSLCNRSGMANASDLEPFISSDFLLINNGRVQSQGIASYLKRIGRIKEKYSHLEISNPHEPPLVCGNKFTVYYTVMLTPREGDRSQVRVMAVATVEDGKLTHWTQVASEKDTGVI